MDFGLSEIQELLASSAREFLADREPFNLARRAAAGDSGFDASFWQEIAQLGWTGLLVPERYGGAGLGLPEFGVLLEECGAALTSGPLLETALLGASVIDRYGNEGQKAELLPAIAGGNAVVTHAIHEQAPAWASNRVGTTASIEDGQWVLRGEKRLVPFAERADVFLVSAETGSGDDCTLFMVRREDIGDSDIVPMKTASGSPVGQLILREVRLPEDAVLGGVGNGNQAVDDMLHLGAVGRSLQMAGAARRVVELTVDYVSDRKQFGQPVGSFQAVQHHCANMALAARGIMLMARRGAWSLSQGQSREADALKAKLYANRELPTICALAHQCHGAIGFTWEHDMHLFTRHALEWRSEYGDSRLITKLLTPSTVR